jgi:hypothetical protein
MKKYLPVLLVLFPSYLWGQNNFMALSFGGNLPLKNFGSYSSLTHHGFALNGFTGDYSGAYFLKNKLGIGGNIRYASNSLDENALINLLAEEFRADYPLHNEPAYLAGFWKYISVIAGPEYTFPRERANFDLYMLTGINFVLPPDMSTYTSYLDNFYDRRLEVSTVNLAFEAGCALRYHLSFRSSIRIHASWFISTCKGDISKKIEVDGEKTSQKIDYSCPINALNAGIGIVYRL